MGSGSQCLARPLLGQVDPTTLFNREPVHPALLERTATMVQPRLDGKHSTSGGSGGRRREDAWEAAPGRGCLRGV